MKEDIKDYLTKSDVEYEEVDDLYDVAPKVDVVYQTRIQRERFQRIEDYISASGKYIIGRKLLDCLPPDSVVMHPLPRVDEIIASEVDDDPRAAYFRQAHNGLYVRMALLKMILAG